MLREEGRGKREQETQVCRQHPLAACLPPSLTGGQTHSPTQLPRSAPTHRATGPPGQGWSERSNGNCYHPICPLMKPGSPGRAFPLGAPQYLAWTPPSANWPFPPRRWGSGREAVAETKEADGTHFRFCASQVLSRTSVPQSPPSCAQGVRPHTPADAQTQRSCKPQCSTFFSHGHSQDEL